MNDRLKNKISIGMSLFISLDEYEKLYDKYYGYITSIYFSPPLDGHYHSRTTITEQLKDINNVKKLYKIIELSKKYNIKLDCVLNTPSLNEKEVINSFKLIDNLDIEQITCLDRHIDILKDRYPNIDFIYSYNNNFNISKLNDISHNFSTIVVGKQFMRDINGLETINRNGFKVKLLVNNGCSFNCGGCINGYRNCIKLFNENLKKYTIEELYAIQSFYPFELIDLMNKLSFEIECIKISNRTDGYDYLDNCLNSYINQIDPNELIDIDSRYYRLYGRLGCFNDYLNKINKDKVLEYKKKGINHV